ncbi:Hypothetical predicted protein [Podarcis lilfordi]|uniref:Uncharacterized protein n=1 Tax=Podarcis lilfordi TaxID=74358 RepID=A0AA35KRG2_9SAUR|nr:Hypothetical predicted protein [Podarcis lilfordi]
MKFSITLFVAVLLIWSIIALDEVQAEDSAQGKTGALNNVIHTIRKRTPEANRNGVEAALLLKGVVNSLSNADKPKVYQPAPDHPVAMS